MDALDSVGDSQLSYSADTESESNSSSTCCSSSSSTKTVSLLDRLRAPTPSTLVRKWKIDVNSAPPQGKKRASGQEEKIYYKNNRGSFWELENRIIGRKKNNVLRPNCSCLVCLFVVFCPRASRPCNIGTYVFTATLKILL